MATRRGHAIVLGSSLAGMMAAAVLARRFERVTVLERDELDDAGAHRKGIPQSRHAHNLYSRGARVLERLFPGLLDELAANGASTPDMGRDGRWLVEGTPMARGETGLRGVLVSRLLIDPLVRRRLAAIPGVEIKSGRDVLGLLGDAQRITGVHVIARIDGSAAETMTADLVVDATGRGSRMPRWLETLGLETVREDQVKVGVAYTTRAFRRRPTDLDGDRFAIVTATPERARGGLAVAVEGDRWLVTLFGYRGEVAPKDLDGFREWARSLAAPDLADLIEHAEPIGDGDTLRHPGSTWRRYDMLRRWPRGLLVLGDAFCSLNPSLGQGITVAAIQADALDASLGTEGDPSGDLERRFFREATKGIMPAWQMSSGNDLRWSNDAPPPNVFQRALGWYMTRYRDAAAHDAELAKRWCVVVNQEAGPQSLLRPALVWRALVRSEAPDRLPSGREALAG